jgi:ABC-type multidrug transport system ATPase subunit
MSDAYLRALRAVPHGPRIDISFSALSLELTVPVADTGITNIASATVGFFSAPFTRAKTRQLSALSGVTGSIRSGTSTLVLGNGGGGKTSLLRRLAARDGPGSGAAGKFGGAVLWNGEAPPKTASKLAAFAPQIDIHEPLLTVRETLAFAAASCLAPLPADASPAEVALRDKLVDHVLDTLELRECEDVILGDELKRGVSGGQKKRVTLGEALLQGSRVLVLDEITNGLDSATATKIIVFLSDWARVTGGTVVVALQAPTPEMFRAFDDVLVLSDGHMLYHGPPAQLNGYLAARGYACPPFMDVADYALALAVSPSYVLTAFPAPAGSPPVTATTREALAAEWLAVKTPGAATAGPLAVGGVSLASPRDAAQYGHAYALSAFRHMSLLVSRQTKIVVRNPAISFGRVFQFVLLGAIFGSVYYKIGLENFITKMSLAIFACSAVSFASFAEIPVIFTGKRVAAKQLDGGFFPPVAFVLSVIVNSLPAAILSTFIFATIMYFMVGFANDAGRYFFFVLALVAHEQATSALFRLYAFVLPSEELTQAMAGISTGSLLIFVRATKHTQLRTRPGP